MMKSAPYDVISLSSFLWKGVEHVIPSSMSGFDGSYSLTTGLIYVSFAKRIAGGGLSGPIIH
jgi:hypothetical protein